MAIEKAKVLAALQLKFKGKSISKTFLDKLATRYCAKIETDADMDDYINDREDDILDGAAEADRRVQAATKKPAEGGKPEVKKDVIEVDDDELKDAPPYVKAMMAQMKGMNETINKLNADKTADTLSTRFLKDERLNGLDPKLLKGRFPKTEEEFEDAVTEAAEDLKDFVKEASSEQQQQEGTPGKLQTKLGNGAAFGDKPVHTTSQVRTPVDAKAKEVPPEIKAFTESLNKSKATI